MLKDNFWATKNEGPMSALPPFDHMAYEEEEEDSVPLSDGMYQTSFEDHDQGEGTLGQFLELGSNARRLLGAILV